MITTLAVAVSQLILGIFITAYTVEEHHVNFPALTENAIWIDCINKTHRQDYGANLNFHIVEYCSTTIHPGGINQQNVSTPVHHNAYFFQYLDHFDIPFPILMGTLICVWSSLFHFVFFACILKNVNIAQKWFWLEHAMPTGMITMSLVYFTGQHNLPLLMSYAIIMMCVTMFPTHYYLGRETRQTSFVAIHYTLLFIYVLSVIIFYFVTTVIRSSDNIQWYLFAQFALGLSVFSPYPSIFALEIYMQRHYYYGDEEDVSLCLPARYVHYLYSGVIRSTYVLLLHFTVFTK